MKMCLLLGSWLLAASAALVLNSSADPVLPYQQPIAQQLTNDLAMHVGDAKTLNSALTTFHRTSKSLSGDTSILRGLDKLLAGTSNYIPLLSNAARAYQLDFQGRRDALNQRLIPAGLGVNKTFARTAIARVDNALSNAVHAATTSTRITRLQTAAQNFSAALNAVQNARNTRLGFSSMIAQIGALSFQPIKGSINGAANFQTADGTFIGQFTSNGTLDVSGFNSGPIARGLSLHVEGIGTNVPATYPLSGENRAFYGVTYRQHEYHFQSNPALTNSLVPSAFISIDFVGTNYLIGRFAFVGTNSAPLSVTDTNTTASVSQGEFQLNFNR